MANEKKINTATELTTIRDKSNRFRIPLTATKVNFKSRFKPFRSSSIQNGRWQKKKKKTATDISA